VTDDERRVPDGPMVQRLLSRARPVAIAHRGGARLRPENTMVAFEHAVSLGVDALECDAHLSRDGEAVVIHDDTLDRTTDGVGPVAACTADELARLDAGCRFQGDEGGPFRGREVGVPRLRDLLRRFLSVPLVIEIKGEDLRTAHRIVDLVLEHQAADRVIVGGFSHAVLSAVRQRCPALTTSASAVEVRAALRRAYLWLPPGSGACRVFQIPLRLRGRRVLTRRFVRALHRGTRPVHAWIVDQPAEMRMLLDWGVTGLISDRPDHAVRVVAERCAAAAIESGAPV
jgi:glycerophosphoryl diester phosphodiesterase